MMGVDIYNRSFEEIIEIAAEECEYQLRSIRQKSIKDFIDRFNRRQKEWDDCFRDLLKKSQECDELARQSELEYAASQSQFNIPGKSQSSGSSNNNNNLFINNNHQIALKASGVTKENRVPLEPVVEIEEPETPSKDTAKSSQQVSKADQKDSQQKSSVVADNDDFEDPHFSNFPALQEYARTYQLLEQTRNLSSEFDVNPALKPYRNQLNIFIRTQINTISNSDNSHLENKAKTLTNFFIGQKISFQDKWIDTNQHPQGKLFSMDLAANTFVTVGTRLVNSVPAIARSMATVITKIAELEELSVFRSLVLGHLQERCPYLVPMHPKLEHLQAQGDGKLEVNYKIACGYSIDPRTQALESEEKYLARMRGMALIYASVLVQGSLKLAWTWLVAFISLRPQPVITATVLQAFLQEASKKMSSVYGRQYKKLVYFIRDHYLKMIDDVTGKTGDRQSFIKLKNLLSDETNLFAAPPVSSIFGTIRT